MFPTLISIGSLTLKTYGLFVALGALAALSILRRAMQKRGQSAEAAEKLLILGMVTGILGSRLLYAWTFGLPWSEWHRIWEGGLSFTGGLIAATTACLIYIRRARLPFGAVTDSMAIALPLGHAIGRLGCLAAGCCWGTPTHLPWAVSFTHPDCFIPTELLGVPVHPAQLYEAAGLMLVFLILSRLQTRFPGRLFGFYLILYSALRFSLEFIRGDALHYAVLGPLSLVQAALLGAALLGILWIKIAPGQSKH